MPHPVKTLLEICENMVEILLTLHVFLAEDQEIECGSRSHSDTWLFCNELFSLWLESVYDDLQNDLTRMADKTNGTVVLAQLQAIFLWECVS